MPKLLGEFLQEQQEPFVLDVYLLERGYYTHVTRDLTCYKPCRGRKKRMQAIPNCTEIVRAVIRRLVLHKSRKIKNTCTNGCGKGIKTNDQSRQEENLEDEDEFSSASATTLYNSCSESDAGDAEFIISQSSVNDEVKISPVSVLDETKSKLSPPLQKKQYNFKKSIKQPTHKFKDGDDQYSLNKRVLQQTRQLMVDCVREVIENERKRDDETGKQLKRILGAEELWKVVYENIWVWSQDSIDERNVVHLLNYDLMASLEEWSCGCDQLRNEIVMEIGDAVLEDIVNEIVTS